MRRSLWLCFLLLAGSGELAADQHDSPIEDARSRQELLETGMQIYRHGIVSRGEDISAKVRGDVALRGRQYACVNCHRRSGIGSSEGGDQIPPIIGSVLFSPQVSGLHEWYTTEGMRRDARPAYTTETLGRALRQGIDPAGRTLSPLMPRFALTDSEVRALSTYLASLTVVTPPGIDKEEIHFATITAPGSTAAGDATREVFDTFFRMKNAGTRNENRRAQNAPIHKEWSYQSYRRWKLHEWKLIGPEQSWPAQLLAYYRSQPVFAVLGGTGSGNWQGVHAFCEQQELPCILPNIASPPSQADRDFYSVYFSRGVELEAEVLAGLLAETPTVIQVRRDTADARAAAGALRTKLAKIQAATAIEDIVVPEGGTLSSYDWSSLAAKQRNAIWVLWLDGDDLKTLATADAGQPAAIYLSATLLGDTAASLQHPLRQRFTLLSPHLPPENAKNARRFLAWARIRDLPVSDLHIQSATFLAATITGEALMHMRGNFSQEYFLERIEHSMESMINPSLYPRLSLAPGQRFAAKGCYVWEMGKDFATAQWVVP